MSFYLSNELLKGHLANLPSGDFKALIAQLGGSPFLSAGNAVRDLSRMGGNSFMNEVIRHADAEPFSYLSLLSKCAGELKAHIAVRAFPELSLVDKYPYAAVEFASEIVEATNAWEQALLGAVFNAVYETLSAEQREQFAENLANLTASGGNKVGSGLAVAGGALVLGNLGGFGTYMAMSSLLSTLSFGTLGFGAYTAASSLLSIALGPVGWAAFGAVLVNRLGAPDKAKMLKAVTSVALAAQSQPRAKAMVDEVSAKVFREREAVLRERDIARADALARKQRQAAASAPKGFFDRLISSGEAGIDSWQESRQVMLGDLDDKYAQDSAARARGALGR